MLSLDTLERSHGHISYKDFQEDGDHEVICIENEQ